MIAKWLGHWSGNQKVRGSIPSVATSVLLFFYEQETLLTLLQSNQPFKLGPGYLVSTGVAGYPAVTSMGNWYKLGRQMPNCLCLA